MVTEMASEHGRGGGCSPAIAAVPVATAPPTHRRRRSSPTSLGQNQGLAATTVAHAGDSFGCSNSAADVEQSWLCAVGEAVGVCHVMAFVHYLAAPFISKRVSGTSYDYKHVLALLTSKTDTTVTTYSLIRPMVCLWIT